MRQCYISRDTVCPGKDDFAAEATIRFHHGVRATRRVSANAIGWTPLPTNPVSAPGVGRLANYNPERLIHLPWPRPHAAQSGQAACLETVNQTGQSPLPSKRNQESGIKSPNSWARWRRSSSASSRHSATISGGTPPIAAICMTAL